jgi:hypothetical protein
MNNSRDRDTNIPEFKLPPIYNKVKELHDLFYISNKKNTIIKNDQKLQCAKYISSFFEAKELIQHTIICNGDNKIYINYAFFKMYGNEDIYDLFINYLLNSFILCIEQFGNFEIHINLKGFTISSVDRYKMLIKLFCDKALSINTPFASLMDKMFIYNSPSVLKTFNEMFNSYINPVIYDKLQFLSDSSSSGGCAAAVGSL